MHISNDKAPGPHSPALNGIRVAQDSVSDSDYGFSRFYY